MIKRGILAFLCVLLVACNSTTPEQATETPNPTETPFQVENRLQLESQYQTLRTLEKELNEVWQTLREGGNVSCGEALQSVSPNGFDESDPIQNQLRTAAIALYETDQLWKAECDLTRQTVPPERIQTALDNLRQAELALNQAETLLQN